MQKQTISAVIGLGFGDEGKGLVTQFLAAKADNPIVVRYSGGQQAGHTVNVANFKHVFASFGSGTYAGASTYIKSACTIDPIAFIREFHELKSKLPLTHLPKVFINSHTKITTPNDVYANMNDKENLSHGTCGAGVGKTIERYESGFNLNAIDLLFPDVLNAKLKSIEENYYKNQLPVETDDFLLAAQFIRENQYQFPIVNKVEGSKYNDIIFESSQGLMLDMDYGVFPNVTRSKVGLKAIYKNTNIKNGVDELYLVTRAYQTRHGNGFMTNEDKPLYLIDNPNETNINNKFQGELRKSLLDANLLEYAIKVDRNIDNHKNKTLVVTCLDQIQDNAFAFTYKNSILSFDKKEDFLNKLAEILNIRKVLYSESPDSRYIKEFLAKY